MSLQSRITQLAQAIGADVKAINVSLGALPSLSTTQKTSLVGAINELKTALDSAVASAGAQIIDTAADNTHTWSAAKIIAQLDQVRTDILNGAPAAYDTLLEISSKLASDDSAIAGLLSAVGNRVSYADAQTLTIAQKAQACANIGVGDPETDLLSVYVSAKA